MWHLTAACVQEAVGGHSVNLWLSAGSVQVKKANKDYTCGSTKMAGEIQYGAVLTWKIFIKNIHKIHPIARPSGRGMECILWIMHLIDILPQFLQLFMQYLTILDHGITALDCTLIRNQSGTYLLANSDSIQPNVCVWENNKQTFVLDHNKRLISEVSVLLVHISLYDIL